MRYLGFYGRQEKCFFMVRITNLYPKLTELVEWIKYRRLSDECNVIGDLLLEQKRKKEKENETAFEARFYETKEYTDKEIKFRGTGGYISKQ